MRETRPGAADARAARAQRILNAAADLLLRWGYKRVTVEDVARHASVGKGTVYLHWKTRDALFYAAVLREGMGALEEVIERIRRDPDEIRLHRLLRTSFLANMARPLLRATLTGDVELLGRLADQGAAGVMESEQTVLRREYCGLLRDHGLMRTDCDLDTQIYALNATATGFSLTPSLLPPEQRPSLEAQADALAATVRDAFEPAGEPEPETVHALAPKIVQLFEQLRALGDRELTGQQQP